jgi:hypothetical protein
MARRGQHHRHYVLHQPLIGSRQEHVLDKLTAELVIPGLDTGSNRFECTVPLGWGNKRRRVDHDNGRYAVEMRGASCRTVTPPMR